MGPLQGTWPLRGHLARDHPYTSSWAHSWVERRLVPWGGSWEGR
jgi:hypothetical protein